MGIFPQVLAVNDTMDLSHAGEKTQPRETTIVLTPSTVPYIVIIPGPLVRCPGIVCMFGIWSHPLGALYYHLGISQTSGGIGMSGIRTVLVIKDSVEHTLSKDLLE
jgi:hypothetical protein